MPINGSQFHVRARTRPRSEIRHVENCHDSKMRHKLIQKIVKHIRIMPAKKKKVTKTKTKTKSKKK